MEWKSILKIFNQVELYIQLNHKQVTDKLTILYQVDFKRKKIENIFTFPLVF